jgi:hypothetical protein
MEIDASPRAAFTLAELKSEFDTTKSVGSVKSGETTPRSEHVIPTSASAALRHVLAIRLIVSLFAIKACEL